jgi:hypothetical protein
LRGRVNSNPVTADAPLLPAAPPDLECNDVLPPLPPPLLVLLLRLAASLLPCGAEAAWVIG